MNRTSRTMILIALALVALLSCSQPETEKPAPAAPPAAAAPETGPDPTAVDADHYKVEFENEQVRVVRITYGPGEQSVMHYHPENVAVFLTGSQVEFGMPDGSSEEVSPEAGQHAFAAAGQHLPRNTGDEPLEVVLVELKSAGPQAGTPAGGEGPDPTVVDADHYKTEFENERVRVIRISYGPGEESVMHYHPDNVAVFLTDHQVEFGMPDGSSAEVRAEAGTHEFALAGQHLPKNIGDEPMELVLVELK